MKKSFEQWITNFRKTHNGNDELGMFYIILALLANIISLVVQIPQLMLILETASLALLFTSVFRFFSTNKSKRYAENYKFIQFNKKIKQWFVDQRYYAKESKTHKFYVCPECKTVCRVPKNKGKIKIKCPNCGHTFIKKT
ncbi:MAG: zinc-ribbon domain-containing protein [Sphaerochaetaceae bacterium]|nr:zinc-ribbon domain-containing protein [Sphaerochaetaceae bacterium]